jgi:hypothetical protein
MSFLCHAEWSMGHRVGRGIHIAIVRMRPSPEAAHAPRTDAVEQKSEATFRAAQAKAEKLGVHKLTQQDIDGLSREQLKQLRGY